jgi:C-terminal processing protease CtpA/Prc
VYIGSFQGDGWGSEIEDALVALGNVAGLILDIRDNTGGNENVAQEVARRFYDGQHVYRLSRYRSGPHHADFASPVSTSLSPGGNRRFSGPVALITNRWNGSAAEDFVLMMRVVPNVTMMGDTTLGLGSNPLVRTTANGWTVRIPQSMQSTPDNFVYQWRGLPPTVAIPWNESAAQANRDPYVDAAMDRLVKPVGQRAEESFRERS